MTTHEFFQRIRDWAADKGILSKGDIKTQTIKLQEEVGELSKAVLDNNHIEVKDAIGDIVVVLTSIAFFNGTTVEDCIDSAYNVIKNRKGKIENGDFKKEPETSIKSY